MNKSAMLIIFLFVLFVNSSFVSTPPNITQAKAKQFILRTNKVMEKAQAALQKDKVYTGDYVLALRHAIQAKKMYNRRNYPRALQHSSRARLLALKVIRANNGVTPPEASFTAEEKADRQGIPTDRELDDNISLDGQHNKKDPDVLDAPLDLDVK
jgi:hypothetical protein